MRYEGPHDQTLPAMPPAAHTSRVLVHISSTTNAASLSHCPC